MARKASVVIEKDEHGFMRGAQNCRAVSRRATPLKKLSPISRRRLNSTWKRCLRVSGMLSSAARSSQLLSRRMPKPPRWTAADAGSALKTVGIKHLRSKGSYRIYGAGSLRVTVPFRRSSDRFPPLLPLRLESIQKNSQLVQRSFEFVIGKFCALDSRSTRDFHFQLHSATH